MVSSQMANSLLMISQHEKMMKESQQEPSNAPEPPAASFEASATNEGEGSPAELRREEEEAVDDPA